MRRFDPLSKRKNPRLPKGSRAGFKIGCRCLKPRPGRVKQNARRPRFRSRKTEKSAPAGALSGAVAAAGQPSASSSAFVTASIAAMPSTVFNRPCCA